MTLHEFRSSPRLPFINFILIVALAAIGIPAVYLLARRGSVPAAERESVTERQEPSDRGSAGTDEVLGSGAALPDTGSAVADRLQLAVRGVVERVRRQVVAIDVIEIVRQESPGSPFEYFFGQGVPRQPREFMQQGLGSGILVRRNGGTYYVLTNNHVVGSASEIGIRLSDGREFAGKLVGSDEYRDLALVSFESDVELSVATLGDSARIMPGDFVLAVGSPFGFESTVTAGIVSAVGRQALPGGGVASLTDYIQTDAAINQGNSGGALVDLSGSVIGVNTWIASPSGGSIGIGFAIPINNAKRAIDSFIDTGTMVYGWFGINSIDPPESIVEDMKLGDAHGSFVIDVYLDSPAAKAGILPGDFITGISGREIPDSNALLYAIGDTAPGERVPVTLLRFGETISVEVEVGRRAGSSELLSDTSALWPGMLVLPLTEETRRQLGMQPGGNILVVEVESGTPAQRAGFLPGDTILTMEGEPVSSLEEFYRALNSENRNVSCTVLRDGSEFRLTL